MSDYRIIKGSLETKSPTIWRDEKHRWEELDRGVEERKVEGRKRKRKSWKAQVREMLGRSRNIVFFHSFVVRRLTKAACAEPSGGEVTNCTLLPKHISKAKCLRNDGLRLLEVRMSKDCTPLRREARVQVKILETLGVRTTFEKSQI